MSIILGVHTVTKLYLVSDTRATLTFRDGRKEYSDDLIKAFAINSRISAIEAGSAAPAAFILKQLKLKLTQDSTMEDLKDVINSDLKGIISDYVNQTGRYGVVALIIGGYNPEKKKKIECSLLGNAMSAPVKAKEGFSVNQTIPPSILNPLIQASMKGFKKGEYLETEALDSEMIAVKIDVRSGNFTVIPVGCYEYITFHPDQEMNPVTMTPELISDLEFRAREIEKFEDVIYPDAEILMAFVQRAIREHEFETVGGNIMVGLVSSNGLILPLGDLAKYKDGLLVKAGSFFTDKDGNLKYILENGQEGKYRFVEFLDDSSLEKLEL